ncbi:MAG: Oligoendopeptidase, M3 family, partial [uncultured bacterium]
IFMNAAGVQDDVETLLHESGHSFHSLQYRNQELYWYRGAPMEFCEVSSMSFELIGGAHFDVFYKDGLEAARARLRHLTSVLELFPWVMTVDAFQHWIYTHPKHSLEERANKWREIHQKFDAGIDWSILPEEVQKNWWHKQLHIFLDPFYYIEYAISQLGALQIYRNYKKNPGKTLDEFLGGMKLGASKSCKEIFEASGIEFRFDVQMVGELAKMVYEEIQQLEKDCYN